jgi:aryl-alcohol dehydrogenase-like predicted oxidoreductase
MEYVRLGNSGLKVSPICLGAFMFGGNTDEQTAIKIIDSAKDSGVNFIDTADKYQNGKSEIAVGKALKKNRDQWVLATKTGSDAMGPGPNEYGLSRKWMMQALGDSLKRLQTDYGDIYYLHRAEPGTPFEETLQTVGDILRSGKARYWGFSNFRAWKIPVMVELAKQMGIPKPVIAQPYYNLINRIVELEYLPACAYYGIGVAPYSVLARGVLTGKYGLGDIPKGSRAEWEGTHKFGNEMAPATLKKVQRLVKHAEKRGMTGSQFATNWCLNNEFVHSVIAGPRTFEQWTEQLDSLKHNFNAKDEALVDKLFPPAYPALIEYVHTKDPLAGRVPVSG